MKYKNYEIEYLKDINKYVVYFSESQGDNIIKTTLEELKVYIDFKIVRDSLNKAYELRKETYLDNLNKALEQKEQILNLFFSTLNKTLQNDKLKFYLRNDIKSRYCCNDIKNNYLTNGSNFENIQILKENGYSAVIKDGFKSTTKDNTYYSLKKSEYLYLKFLDENVFNLRVGFTLENQQNYLKFKNTEI